MRVFITGATGYIGSAVVGALQRSGHDVVGLARSEQAAEALKRAGCEPHLGDITDPAGLTAALAGADAVVHTAVGAGGGVVGDADHAVVDAMLAALAERQGTLVLTSGLSVYAGYRVPFIDEDTPLVDVIPPQRPRVALEERALSGTDRGVRAVVLRPGNVYGGGSAGILRGCCSTRPSKPVGGSWSARAPVCTAGCTATTWRPRTSSRSKRHPSAGGSTSSRRRSRCAMWPRR